MSSPLPEVTPTSASAAPVRVLGTRVRAGNSMGRTRSVLLSAALRLVVAQGTRRTSMADIAAAAGVAKGTLYNHFRTKEDVWSAVVLAEVHALADAGAGLPLEDALVLAARRLGEHPAVRRLAAEEPATLCALVTAPGSAPVRRAAEDAVRALLAGTGRDLAAADLVLRWLESQLTRPGDVETSARLLAGALPIHLG
jgi:AcrR family transcriptional regulator